VKILKGGIVAAILSVLTLGLLSASALALPITTPWTGTGGIELQGGLGGSLCIITVDGFTDGNSIDDASFAGCRGAAGTPTGLFPWPVTWDAALTGGSVDIAAQVTILGVTCLYTGSVPFTYSGGATSGTITLNGTVNRISGGFPCPSSATLRTLSPGITITA